MLPVFICEDNIYQLNYIKEAVILYFQIKYPTVTPHIHVFSNPHELLSSIETHHCPNIYFLDYELDCDMNGLELAEEIRKFDVIGPITFISAHNECWHTSYNYQVCAMNFINKGNDYIQKQISDALTASINYYEMHKKQMADTANAVITIKSARSTYPIHEKDIFYIISTKKEHVIEIHSKNTITQTRDTLSGFMTKLSSDYFYQCNRTSVINLNYITKIDSLRSEVHVKGSRFSLSRAKLKELKTLYVSCKKGMP